MKAFDTQFAVMEYAPDGTDFVKKDGKILLLSFSEARKQIAVWTESTGYSYQAIPFVPGM